MYLPEYRDSQSEQIRSQDLIQLIPSCGGKALDVGARDGYFSVLLAERFESVTALDLEKPSIQHSRITCVKGDITELAFSDNSFDLMLCAEVLEHIPEKLLAKACDELSRVTRKYLLIGVPYKQDIRVGRTTCRSCGKKNPPWGHVNTFDKDRLQRLFPIFNIVRASFIGENFETTNFLSSLLLDLAGNPYGTYDQEEPCIYCGKKLAEPPERNFFQKICTKAAKYANYPVRFLFKPHPNWVHILFTKK
jgi:SAM-dependent methyltransferase